MLLRVLITCAAALKLLTISGFLDQYRCILQAPLLHSGVYVVSGSPQTLQSVCGTGGVGESLEKQIAGRLLNLKHRKR